jgi:hypothetical protein
MTSSGSHGNRTTFALFGGLAIAGAALGCDPVANDNYQGKVLATLHGVVATPTAGVGGTQAPTQPVEVALIWGKPDGMSVKLVAEKVDISGMFPAEFTVQLHHPPPSMVGASLAGAMVSQAFIAALPRTDWKQGTLLDKGRSVEVFGLAREQLFHLDHALAADDPLAVLLGGIHEAGFHLVTQKEITTAEAQTQAAACREVLAAQYAERCDQTPADGLFQGLVEVPGGLSHVIQFALNGPEDRSFIGTGPEDAPPCSDCEVPVSSSNGSTPPSSGPRDGGPGVSNPCGSGSSTSSMGSTGSTGGNSSPSDGGCPEAGAGGGIGDPVPGQP